MKNLLLTAALLLTTAALPSAESVDELVAEGRQHLEAKDIRAAQRAFDRAAELDGKSLRTQVWVLRCWMADGRINDALDATDDLAKEHKGAPAIDYLYGTAFALKAQELLASGTTDSALLMNLEDAVNLLDRATKQEPERFRDGFKALAYAAYHKSPPNLEVGRTASEKAVEVYPKDPTAHLMLGRVTFSQFISTQADESKKAEADSHWSVSEASFKKTLELVGEPRGARDHQQIADTWVQLGNLYAWKQKTSSAAEAYARAAGHSPQSVPFSNLLGSLGNDAFRDMVTRGAEEFVKLHGEKNAADGELHWWRGWANYQAQAWAEAEEAFTTSLTKRPDYTNSHFFVALSRYFQEDYTGAVNGLRAHLEADVAGLVQEMRRDLDVRVPIVRYLTGYAFEKMGDRLAAADMARICAEAVKKDPIHWNNLGLFLRDHGDVLRQREGDEADPKVLADLWQRSFKAYLKALNLAPNDPVYLNDTAVMLHYYLNKDLDQAQEWYEKAVARAEEELARSDLDPELRPLYETAKRDATNNLRKLEKDRAGEDEAAH